MNEERRIKLKKKIVAIISLLPFAATVALLVIAVAGLFLDSNRSGIFGPVLGTLFAFLLFLPALVSEYDLYRIAKYFFLIPKGKTAIKTFLCILRLIICIAIIAVCVWDFTDIALFSVKIATVHTLYINYTMLVVDTVLMGISSI